MRLKHKSVNGHRLKENPGEREALRFFYNENPGGSNPMRELVFKYILGADGENQLGQELPPELKQLGKDVAENRELVETVLDTVFQWLGSCVGSSIAEEMIKSIKENQYSKRRKKV